MEHRSGRELTVSVDLRLVTVDVPADGPSTIPCPGCRRPIDVHQPDADQPDRMLATCDNCKGWSLVECSSDGATALVVLLPDVLIHYRRHRRGRGGESSRAAT